jgi:hypothetical protein
MIEYTGGNTHARTFPRMTQSETSLTVKRLTISWLTAFFGMFIVAAIVWCVQRSAVVFDIGVVGEELTPQLSLFQRLHWLWQALLLIPGVYIGATGVRASVLCGSVSYAVGAALGWCLAEWSRVLSDSILRPALWRFLGEQFCFGAVLGAVLVVVGLVCRRVALKIWKFRKSEASL